MGTPAINSLALSDVHGDRIQRQASDCSQTLARVERMIARSKSAAQRGNVKAEQFLDRVADELYSSFAEWRLDEPEWEVE